LIIPLDQEHTRAWISLYKKFYAQFPWNINTGIEQIRNLTTEAKNTESWIFIDEKKVTAIGTLTADDDRHNGTVQNFAFSPKDIDNASKLLKHLLTRAKIWKLETVTTTTWENVGSIQKLLTDAGFHFKNQMALMHLNPANIKIPDKEQYFTIRSLADGLSIDAFVESNHIAFAEDSSRPLEKIELERWIDSIPGFHADMQLAAIIDEKIVGTVMSEIEEIKKEDSISRHAWIYGFGVVPEARRRGIATHLLRELSCRFSVYGVSDIWALTDFEGPIRLFYEAVGFTYQTNWIEFAHDFDLSLN